MEQFVVVFNTKEEADALQERDYGVLVANSNNTAYDTVTTKWAVPRERNDGKFDYPIYHEADYTGYLLEEYDPKNYHQTEK